MSKPARAGAVALVAGPVLGIVATIVLPTLSDDAGDLITAATSHHAALVVGLTLQTLSIPVMIGGLVWLAMRLVSESPRLAVAGGILGVAGGLLILFEDGISDVTPSLVGSLDAGHAHAALHQVSSSVAAGLDPLALVFDLGVVLLGFAAVKAGAPRWVAPALTVSALAQGIGFGSAARPLVILGFAAMAVLLAIVVRSLNTREAWNPAQRAVATA